MGKHELEEWKRMNTSHILSFDGASKGNPGVAGGGGVLVSPTEITCLSFAWGMGFETNNKEESLSLWQGLTQALILKVHDLLVLRDSKIIIQALIQHTRVTNAKL